MRARLFGACKSVSDVNGTASFFCRGGIPRDVWMRRPAGLGLGKAGRRRRREVICQAVRQPGRPTQVPLSTRLWGCENSGATQSRRRLQSGSELTEHHTADTGQGAHPPTGPSPMPGRPRPPVSCCDRTPMQTVASRIEGRPVGTHAHSVPAGASPLCLCWLSAGPREEEAQRQEVTAQDHTANKPSGWAGQWPLCVGRELRPSLRSHSQGSGAHRGLLSPVM